MGNGIRWQLAIAVACLSVLSARTCPAQGVNRSHSLYESARSRACSDKIVKHQTSRVTEDDPLYLDETPCDTHTEDDPLYLENYQPAPQWPHYVHREIYDVPYAYPGAPNYPPYPVSNDYRPRGSFQNGMMGGY